MSLSQSTALPVRSEASEQESAKPRGGARGAGSASGGGRGPRRPNLPFGFRASALGTLSPPALAESLRNRLLQTRQTGLKDGVDLSDSEKLYVVVEALRAGGHSDQKIETVVGALFFDKGTPAKGRDDIATIELSPGEVKVTFVSPGGYAFNQGAILPMICSAPVQYTGQDTNARGSLVRRFQATGELQRAGSWLVSQAATIDRLFLLEPEGAAFAGMTASARQSDPDWRRARYAYDQELALDYLPRAKEFVRQQLGPVGGRTPQQLLQAALRWAMAYANPNLGAVAHTTIETQDEAVAQGVLEDLGYTANIDTDTPAASSAAVTGP